MGFYCYSVRVDGQDQIPVGSNSSSVEAAIAHGRAMLLATVASIPALEAHCVVSAEGGDSAAIGVWNWSVEAGEALWSAAH